MLQRGVAPNALNWSRRISAGWRINLAPIPTGAGVARFSVGKSGAHGPLTNSGVMIQISAGGVVTGIVHNGVSPTTVALGTYVAGDEWTFLSDGTGNVSFFDNGVFIASTTGGPTNTTTNLCNITMEIENGATATNFTFITPDVFFASE
jgi:hypothetical protein